MTRNLMKNKSRDKISSKPKNLRSVLCERYKLSDKKSVNY